MKQNKFFSFTGFTFRFIFCTFLIVLVFSIIDLTVFFFDFSTFNINTYRNKFVSTINNIAFKKSCLFLRKFVPATQNLPIETNEKNLTIINEIPKKHICGDNTQAFSCNEQDLIDFKHCIVTDEDGNASVYPLIVRICSDKTITFDKLSNDMTADTVFAILPKISCLYEKNMWFVSEGLVQIYPPANVRSSGVLRVNDIDLIKSNLDKQMDYLDLEINRLKSQITTNYAYIVREIKKYLLTCSLPNSYKKEIEDVFCNPKNINNCDEYLSELIQNLERICLENNSYQVDLDFFNQLYKKCIKIDHSFAVIADQELNLYDMLFKDKKSYFDKIILQTYHYVQSHILETITINQDCSNDDIFVEYGNFVKVGSESFQIDQKGCVKLNPILCKNLKINSTNLFQTIYTNVILKKYILPISNIWFCVILVLSHILFVPTLFFKKRYVKWIVVLLLLFLSIILTVLFALMCIQFDFLSMIILIFVFVLFGLINDTLLNENNVTKQRKD